MGELRYEVRAPVERPRWTCLGNSWGAATGLVLQADVEFVRFDCGRRPMMTLGESPSRLTTSRAGPQHDGDSTMCLFRYVSMLAIGLHQSINSVTSRKRADVESLFAHVSVAPLPAANRANASLSTSRSPIKSYCYSPFLLASHLLQILSGHEGRSQCHCALTANASFAFSPNRLRTCPKSSLHDARASPFKGIFPIAGLPFPQLPACKVCADLGSKHGRA